LKCEFSRIFFWFLKYFKIENLKFLSLLGCFNQWISCQMLCSHSYVDLQSFIYLISLELRQNKRTKWRGGNVNKSFSKFEFFVMKIVKYCKFWLFLNTWLVFQAFKFYKLAINYLKQNHSTFSSILFTLPLNFVQNHPYSTFP
jgi:hypothetical protein